MKDNVSIVCIGGGTGLHAELSGLKELFSGARLSAVVTMMDSGSNSGKLRDEFGYLPPGDIRQCLVALSDAPVELRQLMQYRFQNEGSGLHGHVIGNLLLTALKDIHRGDEYAAIKAMEHILHLRGSVYPVTLTDAHIVATLDDGSELVGEGHLYGPLQEERRIVRLRLEPEASLFPPTRAALAEADYIIIGPGGLHNSILPNLVVSGMVQALHGAKQRGARIMLVTNTMTKHGDTDGYRVSDFMRRVQDALDGVPIDAVIANTGTFPPQQLAQYAAERSEPVVCDVADSPDGPAIITGDFVPTETFLKHGRPTFARHDPRKLAAAIAEAIRRLSCAAS